MKLKCEIITSILKAHAISLFGCIYSSLTRKPSRRMKSTEFCLIKALPVDLFPLTYHYELVMLFERYNHQEDALVPTQIDENNTRDEQPMTISPARQADRNERSADVFKVENVPAAPVKMENS